MNNHSPIHTNRRCWQLALVALFLLSLACGLPSAIQSVAPQAEAATPLPTATITPTPQPLPPGLVEVDPSPGSKLAQANPVTIYFNQPMDWAAVEAALSVQFTDADSLVQTETLNYNWLDDTTLSISPVVKWPDATSYQIEIGTSAKALNGLTLVEPFSASYQTAPPLKVVQVLPEPGLTDVDPNSAIVVSFNQPVVALGADPATLPEALVIDPPIQGSGEWVNTSTYILYPDNALFSGHHYAVSLNPGLSSTTGVTLASVEQWDFTTASPRLTLIEPGEGSASVPLDSSFTVTFNQSMHTGSVEAEFALRDAAGNAIPGGFEWQDDDRVLIFTPMDLLARNADYQVVVPSGVQTLGGTPLGEVYTATVSTVSDLMVIGTEPLPGESIGQYDSPTIYLSSSLESKDDDDLLPYLSVSPEVDDFGYWLDAEGRTLNFYGNYTPLTQYQLTISANLPDVWGDTLGADYVLEFQTGALNSNLIFTSYSPYLFITPDDTSMAAQATNLESVDLLQGSVPFGDFVSFLHPDNYSLFRDYQPADGQTWQHSLNLPGDRMYEAQIPLTPDGSSLPPGLYHIRMSTPAMEYPPGPYVLVSSYVHLTFKLSATQAFVWAVDLRTNQPVADASVGVYAFDGTPLANGVTNQDGVFKASINPQEDLFGTYYALLGQPGQDNFALTLDGWSQGIAGYDFGLRMDTSGPQEIAYIYTDRPIYRPGQTVSFRAIVRQEYNGRYTPTSLDTVPITIYDHDRNTLLEQNYPPSAYGTVHGQYAIPVDAQPGTYEISTPHGYVWFDVAEYRKPEINLQVSTIGDIEHTLADQVLQAQVQARYFFDAPAGDLDLSWYLYKDRERFYLPGYWVGLESYGWIYPSWMSSFFGYYGEAVDSGEGRTNSQGILDLELEIAPEERAQLYTLEVTMTDESGYPVSARTEFKVHPAEFYIGIRPDIWVGQAGQQITFDVLTVDWESAASSNRALSANFQEVTWVRQDSNDPYLPPEMTPQYTPVGNTDFITGDDGVARIAFTPPEAGTYQLEIQAADGTAAKSQITVWVGGQGQAVWPNMPNQRLRLTADKDSYLPGDTAQIFIPNPLGAGTQALVTVERGLVIEDYVLILNEAGYTLPIALSDDSAPNIYVSATLIGPEDEFRQGYLNLSVEPSAQELSLEVTAISNDRDVACNVSTECVEHTEPRQDVTFDLRVTDSNGNPVQGEFSLAVADLAALALADPNSEEIMSAFYGVQPLGVSTSLALTLHTKRQLYTPGGMGGGGGDDLAPFVREDFPDTAYWNAQIITDANGQAQATFTLPDSLTTWHVDIRGLTTDTRVGQAETHVVTSKSLLVRPVTPRFMVVGDHTRIAAVVHNNSATDLKVEVALQGAGFTLDDPASALQKVAVTAGGRQHLSWWGTVEDVEQVSLIFSASGENDQGDILYQDVTRPTMGDIPVARYLAPQTFGTAGVLEGAAQRLELVSLPSAYEPSSGYLDLELDPSLAAAMVAGLDVLEHYPYECTEQTVSRFLPNLETYRAIQSLGLDAPDFQARLDRTLNAGLQRLIANQNQDGGWGWWPETTTVYEYWEEAPPSNSDPYVSAYVLFGLSRAKVAGVFVDEAVIQNARNYLLTAMGNMWTGLEAWQLDRIAFIEYVLIQAEYGAAERMMIDANELYTYRDQLSPWAKAMLAMTFKTMLPDDPRTATLFSDLHATAIHTATSTHWEGKDQRRNMENAIFNSAVVIYALAQDDPASPTLPQAVRYLMDHRDAQGAWNSTYATAWTLLALTEVMKGTGELAGDYSYTADVNGTLLAQGQAGGDTRLNAVTSSVPVAQLYGDYPNALTIQREAGPGRLYYTAHLNVLRPVEDVQALDTGIGVARAYYPLEIEDASALQSGQTGDLLKVRLTIALENEAYYLMVEDYIPSGAEILDTNLKTSQQGLQYEVDDPFGDGWGWWLFNDPLIYDDHIAWAVDYLPPGTYELTYILVLNQPGQYRVIPAQAWQFYFPEVQGNSAGMVFEIVE